MRVVVCGDGGGFEVVVAVCGDGCGFGGSCGCLW